MKKIVYTLLLVSLACTSCKFAKNETPTRGATTIMVDETFSPMIEGQAEMFESRYKYAALEIAVHPEQEIVQLLTQDTSRIAILSRNLTAGEQAYFEQKNIIPRVTGIAFDAIALIVNKNVQDSVISQTELQNLLKGSSNSSKYDLVFDNAKSSTVQYMMHFADVETLPKNVYAVAGNREMLRYVAEHNDVIGFVGLNWLYEPDTDLQQYVDKVKVLAISAANGSYKPTQQHIASGNYPFIRKISIINCQGSAGLGLGFASFMASEVGQRIVLKSGLAPVRYPEYKVQVRKQL